MKKALSSLFIFVFLIMGSFWAIGQPRNISIASFMGDSFGYRAGSRFDMVRPPDRNILDLAQKGIGGVAFAGIAVPAGNAVGAPLSLRYIPTNADGRRLEVTVGNSTINSGLYDWELVPLIRYADSGSWACVTLLSEPNADDSLSVFEKAFELCEVTPDNPGLVREYIIAIDKANEAIEKTISDIGMLDENDPALEEKLKTIENNLDETIFIKPGELRAQMTIKDLSLFEEDSPFRIFWAAYNPGLGNTLVGINLLLVDAMFVSNSTGIVNRNIIDLVKQFPEIPNYTDNRTEQAVSLYELEEGIMNALMNNEDGFTYIFSDEGIPITYEIKNGRMVFTGFPYYQFMKVNDEGEYEFVAELQSFMRDNYSTVKSICPEIYDAAERWCHWSALFRAVIESDQTKWESFFNSVSAIYPYNAENPEQTEYPEHSYRAPRIWKP